MPQVIRRIKLEKTKMIGLTRRFCHALFLPY